MGEKNHFSRLGKKYKTSIVLALIIFHGQRSAPFIITGLKSQFKRILEEEKKKCLAGPPPGVYLWAKVDRTGPPNSGFGGWPRDGPATFFLKMLSKGAFDPRNAIYSYSSIREKCPCMYFFYRKAPVNF